jgi:hypothetical protein
MITINIWGAPSSGKSTTAAGLFFLMKINKQKVELVYEYAKELVLDQRENVFGDQNYILAKQERRIARLNQHDYDFAITDSPLPLVAFYDTSERSQHFLPLVMDHFNAYNNINYFLVRRHAFEKIGRRHNEAQAIQIEQNMRAFLDRNKIEFQEIEANPRTPETIWLDIQRRMAEGVSHLPFSPDVLGHGPDNTI